MIAGVLSTEIKAEQRTYALRMLQRCVQTLQEHDPVVDRELLQEAASWAVIAEALRRRT